MPFRFLDEITTSDVAFEAWGETLEEMFSSSAEALLRTMVEKPRKVRKRQVVAFSLEHEELDLLLFSFLQEFIYYKDARRLLLHPVSVKIAEMDGLFHLESVTKGEEIDPLRHPLLVDVKAVTLHRFHVGFESDLWKATVVLDV